MNEYKRLTTTSVTFILIFIIVYFVSCFLLPRRFISDQDVGERAGYSLRKFRDIEQYKNIDLLFLGSSHAYRGFDVRIFEKEGYKCFNLGTTAQTPMNTYFLVNDYLDALNPKVAVFEIYFELLNNQGLESYLNLTLNKPLSLNHLSMALQTKSPRALNTFISEVLKRRTNPLDAHEQLSRENEIYITGGYVQKLSWEKKERKIKKSLKLDYTHYQFKYIEKIVNMLAKKNIKLFLVVQPLPNYNEDVYKDVENYFIKFSKDKNIFYHNFNITVTLDEKEHFVDENHLSQPGVIIFNEAILNLLKS